MKTNIKSLEDYKNRKRYWRVLKDTNELSQTKKKRMIGGIFEQRAFYDDGTVSLYNDDKLDYWLFSLSDLQEVYGEEVDGKVRYFEKDGYAIGVGDTIIINGVREWIVYDFKLVNNDIILQSYRKDKGAFRWCGPIHEDSVDRVIPIYKPNQEMSDEELVRELERRGKIKNGKIIY